MVDIEWAIIEIENVVNSVKHSVIILKNITRTYVPVMYAGPATVIR